MRAIKLLVHLLVPHESNNQKAKILHPSGLLLITFLMVVFQFVNNIAPKTFPRVLGYAANISPEEVINLTNAKRAENGLSPLTSNSVLSSAALAKGNDMLSKGYWAHFAPDGTSPWSFFVNFGYKYKYAGENLARDFSNPGSAVEAWMASPTHKENILNPKYKEIGIGVVEGSLAGVDTTIVVQFFGTPQSAQAALPIAEEKSVTTTVVEEIKPKVSVGLIPSESTPNPIPSPTPIIVSTPPPVISPVTSVQSETIISPFTSAKTMSVFVTTMLLTVLAIDLVIVRKRKIVRIGGRTLAHIAFFGMILAVLMILKAGKII